MEKKGIEKFLGLLSLGGDDDDDYDTDDLFDSEIDLVEPKVKKDKAKPERNAAPAKSSGITMQKSSTGARNGSSASYNNSSRASEGAGETADLSYRRPPAKQSRPTVSTSSKVVSMNRGSNQVFVIRPNGYDETQTITDFLKEGRTIVINLEGIEIGTAQRIIDFVGGACYAMEGSLQAITANQFIAAPPSIEVSGDLREEFLGGEVSPTLGNL